MIARPLAELLPAAAGVLGVPGLPGEDWLAAGPVGSAEHIVILLVDGLGHEQLAAHLGVAPRLGAMTDLGPLAAPFPATTSVSLTSFGTGLPPGLHGIVGSMFRLDGRVLAPLSWGADPNPIATQPEPTILERAAAAGVLVVSAAPARFRASGLTRAALRGGEYAGAETSAERVAVARDAVARARAASRRSLVYVYWPDLDKAAHVHGAASAQYRAELAAVDRLVADLAELARRGVALLVTADHGIVDVPDSRRFDIESRPVLRRGVQTILGEPRVRHVYTATGRSREVQRNWAEELGERALVLLREEAADLYGSIDPWHADRIGDVVAIANADWALVSDRVDRLVSSLRGQHGGLTDAEVLVPLRLAIG
ncbi:MAG: nucleotide pyrophosphatase/phosphodiesterase family protein [Candidatus Nanopelagicales bacterium]